MIYPSDFEEKTGFTPLRQLLKDYCASPQGRECVDAMKFSNSFNHVSRSLRQTAELTAVLRSGAPVPDPGLPDVSSSLSVLKAEGSYIPAERFAEIKRFLEGAAKIHGFCARSEDGRAATPALARLFGDMAMFPQVIGEIDRVIDRFGQVRENASPELKKIVSGINSLQSSMSSIVRKVIGDAVQRGLVDKDTTPAIRDGRPVIPVSAQHKRAINGIVHDMSATGKTAFIEPAEVVEAANRLRELENERHREEVLILTALSATIRPEVPAMEGSFRLAALFDFIHAKAKLAVLTDARMPVLEKKSEFDWFHAVHPTLALTLRRQGREVVPFDLRLTPEQRFLVISGPNAGGKSVTLKTVGIVQYMLQCGLLPTLYENSHVSVLRNIFIDIGDEQSIENDLSTYSSHLRNMKYFLRGSDADTLVLADEIGSGTEPQIGSALAQAILRQLGRSRCFGVVTTHYQNIKELADHEPGFVNGAMLYDRQKFRPLFQLDVGHPGSSFAVEIAKSIGLPEDIINEAKEIVGSDYINIDKYILDIQRDRRYWANKRLSIREKEHKIEKTLQDAENRADSLRTERNAILREAKQQAREILDTANARIERTILEIRNAQAEKEQTRRVRSELEEYRRDVEKGKSVPEPKLLAEHRRPKKKTEAAAPKTGELKAGDFVKMQTGGVIGRILAIEGKKAQVAFGELRTYADLSKLLPAQKPKESASTGFSLTSGAQSAQSRERQLNFNRELDVRGMRADEALQAVTYFIDDAVQFSADRVRILHGTGTGALRMAIRQWLAANPAVEKYHDEDVRFGGAGITVVELDS